MKDLKNNCRTVLGNPRMFKQWIRWQLRRVGAQPEVRFKFARLGSFRSFSEYWSVAHMAPSDEELALIRRTVLPGTLNLDVGANVGVFSFAMANACSSAQIHSFEPTPDTFIQLEANIRLNGTKNIHGHQLAVGTRRGSATFNVN